MPMVKVKSQTRNGSKVNSYTRSSGNSSYRVGDYSPKGIVKNFITATEQTPVPKAITSGNKVLDYVIQSKIAQKTPVAGVIIKAYNYGSAAGTNIARGQIAITESCFNKTTKKK